MPQIVFVIEIDASDDGDHRRNHIGGVQPATQTDLDDRKFHALLRKGFKGQCGDALEIGGMRLQLAFGQQLFNHCVDARKYFRKALVGNLLTGDADAFIDAL